MRKIIAAGSLLVLASCSAATPPDNMAVCLADIDRVPSANVMVLLAAAMASPACEALGWDVIQQLVSHISFTHAQRGMRR